MASSSNSQSDVDLCVPAQWEDSTDLQYQLVCYGCWLLGADLTGREQLLYTPAQRLIEGVLASLEAGHRHRMLTCGTSSPPADDLPTESSIRTKVQSRFERIQAQRPKTALDEGAEDDSKHQDEQRDEAALLMDVGSSDGSSSAAGSVHGSPIIQHGGDSSFSSDGSDPETAKYQGRPDLIIERRLTSSVFTRQVPFIIEIKPKLDELFWQKDYSRWGSAQFRMVSQIIHYSHYLWYINGQPPTGPKAARGDTDYDLRVRRSSIDYSEPEEEDSYEDGDEEEVTLARRSDKGKRKRKEKEKEKPAEGSFPWSNLRYARFKAVDFIGTSNGGHQPTVADAELKNEILLVEAALRRAVDFSLQVGGQHHSQWKATFSRVFGQEMPAMEPLLPRV